MVVHHRLQYQHQISLVVLMRPNDNGFEETINNDFVDERFFNIS